MSIYGYRNSKAIWALCLFCMMVVLLYSTTVIADCGAPRRMLISNDGALAAYAKYNASQSTQDVSSYDITITNVYGAWYFVGRSHPNDGCWPFYGEQQQDTIPLDQLPLYEVIGPWQTITFENVQVRTGDRFALCHVGLFDQTGNFSWENTWVSAISTIDMISLGIFGEDIATDSLSWNPTISTFGIVSGILDAANLGTSAAVSNLIQVAADPDSGIWDMATAIFDLAMSTVHMKSAAIEAMKALGVQQPYKKLSDSFSVLSAIGCLFNAKSMIDYWGNAYHAYTSAPWGSTGFEVVSSSTWDNQAPDGYILEPFENQVVGNVASIRGVASDDCSGIDFVNLTYTTDNWQTYHFAGQDSSAPYEFEVDLSAIPDGTTVKFGWDVYDNEGNYADSPLGNRTVLKHAAALAPPTDDAAYMSDITYPDGVVLSPGEFFTKTWRIKNSGTSSWTSSYRLSFVDGTQMGSTTSVSLPQLSPGSSSNVSVNLTAPTTPGVYASYWRPKNGSGTYFGTSVFALIEVRSTTDDPGTCDFTDMCVNMGCSSHEFPTDGMRFKTPGTGTGVYYGRANYKHAFPDSICYHLLYDDFHGTQCIADEIAAQMGDAPYVCTEGSFIRVSGESAIYRLQSGRLRALCGDWTSSAFESRYGYPFQIAVLTDSSHFEQYEEVYPILGSGIYPPGEDAPQCGDPGYECGYHDDPDDICFGHLNCEDCPAGKQCVSGTCVSTGPYCGDGSCDDGDGETCSNCEVDCGPCMELIPGYITSPNDGETVDNREFDIYWENGYASDGSATKTAILCRVNGNEWNYSTAYGVEPPDVFSWHGPGDLIECKARTRLNSDYETWVDSSITQWIASTDYPNIIVKSVVLRETLIPNGCEDLYLDATFENIGNREGDWRARAFLHPSGEDYTSVNAIKARFDQVLFLQPAEEEIKEFRIDSDVTIPLLQGEWQITVISDDYYEDHAEPNTKTIDIHGEDSTPPEIVKFQLYAFEGDPMEVVPGSSYTVYTTSSDNYHIEDWEMDWRIQGGEWQTIAMNSYPDRVCNTSDAGNAHWEIPDGLAADVNLELRFRVWDLAKLVDTQSINVITRSHEEPSLTIVSPQGGESFVWQTSSANPSCIPVEAYYTPGEPLLHIKIGYYNPVDGNTLGMLTLTGEDIPSDGHIDECIPATKAGDNIVVFVRLYDANGDEFYFYANPVTVNFPPATAPWQNIVVEQTQYPLPRPDYGSASSTMGFNGLAVKNNQVSLYRIDSRWWLEGYSTKYSELAISSLLFSYDGFQFVSSVQIIPTTQEAGSMNRPDDILEIGLQNANGDFASRYDLLIESSCENQYEDHCDYEYYVREIENNAINSPEFVATYLDRESIESPSSRYILRSPLGNKLLAVQNSYNETYSTDLYRKTTQWELMGNYSPTFSQIWSEADGLHVIQKITNASDEIEWHDRVLNEETGDVVSDVIIFADTERFSVRNFAQDLENSTSYLMVWNYEIDHMRLFKYSGGEWNEIKNKYFGTSWKGYTISNLWPQSLMARNGHLYFFTQLQCDDSYGTHEIAVHFTESEDIDLETGFEETAESRHLVIDENGGLMRVIFCEWNLQNRLCLQKTHLTFDNCYDADPCTEDIWNPDSGQCEYPAIQCEQDGNACNGPEVCEATTGDCVTDSAQALVCDDGDPCNGVESCIEETGECSVSDVPEIDDGYSCTIDECDEETGNVSNTPQDEQCVTDACHSAVCDPGSDDADQETGCVFTELAIEPDNLDCTQDTCDPDTGDPVYELIDGNCLIGGVCYADEVPNPGTSCKVCDSESPYQWSNVQNGTNCEDGEYCTVNDSCISGVCIGSARDCSGQASDLRCQSSSCDEQQNICIVSNFQDGTSCADFDVCDGEETCQSGTCSAGTSLDCGDGHDCTTDGCNAETGCFSTVYNGNCLIDNQCYSDGVTPTGESCRVCLSSASKIAWTNLPDTIPCNDGNLCTHTDRCDGAGGCGGTEITCTDDPDVCGANRACDGSTECVVSYPDAETSCDDENLCTYTDKCNGSGGCTGTEIACNDDAEICGADRECNGSDSCTVTYPGSETSCDDDDLCTYSDQCSGDGACSGTEIVCTDDEATCGANRSCDGTDECVVEYPDNQTGCDDTDPCTYADSCNGQGGCLGTEIVCTDDDGICAADRSCNGTDECDVSYPESSTACNADDNGCTEDDHCDGSGLCVAGTEIPCGHLDDECNTGICVSEDAGTASCQKDPSDHVGNNCGEASTDCSGQDTCDEYGVCQSNDYDEGTACDYEDNPCLVQDSCDGSGVCSDNGILEDGAYCDEEDSGSSRCYDGTCLVMQDGETCDLAASFDFQAFSTTESSINTLSLYPNCGDVEYIGSDAFYFIELDAGSYEISLSTSSSTFDPVLLILNGCDPVNCIAYSDSVGPGIGETLSLSVPSETRSDNSYIIAIDSIGTAGAYELRIESIEPDGDIDLDDDWDMEADVFDIDEETQEVELVDQDTETIDGDIDSVDSADIDFDLDTDLDVPADGDMEGDLDPDSVDADSSDREPDKDFVDGDDDFIADGDILSDGDESLTDGDQAMTDGDLPTVDGDESGCDPGTEDCKCYGNDTCNNGLTCLDGLCSIDTGGGDDGGCRSPGNSSAGGFWIFAASMLFIVARRKKTFLTIKRSN